MTIYFSDENGRRKIIAQNDICLVDLKLTDFSEVAETTSEIADDDNVLTAPAKIWNHRQIPLRIVSTPKQSTILTYTGSTQNPTWNDFIFTPRIKQKLNPFKVLTLRQDRCIFNKIIITVNSRILFETQCPIG